MKSRKNIYLLCLVALFALTFLLVKQHDSKIGSSDKSGSISTSQDSAANSPSTPANSTNTANSNQNSNTVNTGNNTASTASNTTANTTTADQHASAGTEVAATKIEAPKKQNNCFNFSYQHIAKNQNRDIEEFLNDTNAFPIVGKNVNQKSICVKVNNKPVNHKLMKRGDTAEVVIGSVVGPDSTIQVSYCVGAVSCRESCEVKTKNKVDELLSDNDVGGVENAELESQVKELRNVASVHEDLMNSTMIREWNQLQSKEWVCEK